MTFFNNSQEIDMELLSSQFQPNPTNTYQINLVDQSLASVARGYAIPGTEYAIADLPFNPADGYHEYRIDFIPGLIIYYADDQVIGTLNGSIPSQPGHMILTQWSNGDPTWSGGPPVTDAVLAIAGVRAYFNSSDPTRQAAAAARCTDPTAGDSVCYIPDYNPGSNSLFVEYFSNEQNKTVGQRVYGKSQGLRTKVNKVIMYCALASFLASTVTDIIGLLIWIVHKGMVITLGSLDVLVFRQWWQLIWEVLLCWAMYDEWFRPRLYLRRRQTQFSV